MLNCNDLLTMDARAAHATPYRVRCGIILVRRDTGSLLVVREKPRADFVGNIIGIPKGALLNIDRDFFACASRELREETGIDLAKVPHSRVSARFVFNNRFFRDVLFAFVVLIDSARGLHLKPDEREISECMWFTLRDLEQNRATVPAYMVSLTNYLCEESAARAP